MWVLLLQRLTLSAALDVLYFPLWWYTAGARRALLWCGARISDANDQLSPGLWLKNIFVPMFGQSDLQGRLMSFFMRLMNVILRSIALVFWSFGVMIFFVIWIVMPIGIGYMFFVSLLR